MATRAENQVHKLGNGGVRRPLWTLVRLAVGVGLIVYLAQSRSLDFRSLGKLTHEWPVSVAAVGLFLFDLWLTGVRLSWLLRALSFRLPIGRSWRLTLISFSFSRLLPGAVGGDLARLFYTTRENRARRAEIAAVVVLDRAIGLLSMLMLPLLLALIFPEARQMGAIQVLLGTVAVLAGCLVAALTVCVLHPAKLYGFEERLLGFLPRAASLLKILTALQVYREKISILFGALGISLVANFCDVGVTALALFALHRASLGAKALLVIPMGYVVNALPITPGGIGVGEAAFNALFAAGGIEGGADALLCWRVWAAAISVLGLALYVRGLGTRVVETPTLEQQDASGSVVRESASC